MLGYVLPSGDCQGLRGASHLFFRPGNKATALQRRAAPAARFSGPDTRRACHAAAALRVLTHAPALCATPGTQVTGKSLHALAVEPQGAPPSQPQREQLCMGRMQSRTRKALLQSVAAHQAADAGTDDGTIVRGQGGPAGVPGADAAAAAAAAAAAKSGSVEDGRDEAASQAGSLLDTLSELGKGGSLPGARGQGQASGWMA